VQHSEKSIVAHWRHIEIDAILRQPWLPLLNPVSLPWHAAQRIRDHHEHTEPSAAISGHESSAPDAHNTRRRPYT
jgi:hypothetical protein